MKDIELVAEIKAGNSAALAEVIELYQKKVYNSAYAIVGNPQDAMDIAQDTFIRAWSRIGTWRGETGLAPWLCRIAANLAIDFLRKHKRLIPVADIKSHQEVQPSVEADLLREETKFQLEQAVAALPLEYRQLVILRHSGEMSYQEMADLLGLSLSQVKNRLLRARQMLRKSLMGRVD